MVEAGLCTWKQFESGKELLLDRMESVVTAPDKSLTKNTNKWSKLKHPTDVINMQG